MMELTIPFPLGASFSGGAKFMADMVQGPADIVRHVIGCKVSLRTRIENA